MTVDTLQTIAAVLPLVALTLVIERRGVHLRLRKRTWFRNLIVAGTFSALFGTGLAIVGIALAGLDGAWSLVLWVFVAVSFVGLFIGVLAMIATSEAEEDEESEGRSRARFRRPTTRPGRSLTTRKPASR